MKILNNPIATNDQKEHEILANEVFHEKEVINRRKEIRAYWLDLVKPTETMLSCLMMLLMKLCLVRLFGD